MPNSELKTSAERCKYCHGTDDAMLHSPAGAPICGQCIRGSFNPAVPHWMDRRKANDSR